MPSFGDSIFLFVLALLLFGPKKLPVLARELGKWIGEFRRASNEFKMQMEEELRQVEQADRQKRIEAMEAAAPVPPAIEESDTPRLETSSASGDVETYPVPDVPEESYYSDPSPEASEDPAAGPLPIATSGELSIMPPETGLPTPHTKSDPLGGLLDSIPETGEGSSTARPVDAAVTVGAEDEAHVR